MIRRASAASRPNRERMRKRVSPRRSSMSASEEKCLDHETTSDQARFGEARNTRSSPRHGFKYFGARCCESEQGVSAVLGWTEYRRSGARGAKGVERVFQITSRDLRRVITNYDDAAVAERKGVVDCQS